MTGISGAGLELGHDVGRAGRRVTPEALHLWSLGQDRLGFFHAVKRLVQGGAWRQAQDEREIRLIRPQAPRPRRQRGAEESEGEQGRRGGGGQDGTGIAEGGADDGFRTTGDLAGDSLLGDSVLIVETPYGEPRGASPRRR